MNKTKPKDISCTAVTIIEIPGAPASERWKVCTLEIADGKVVHISETEGNLRSVAVENLKIQVVREFFQ